MNTVVLITGASTGFGRAARGRLNVSQDSPLSLSTGSTPRLSPTRNLPQEPEPSAPPPN
jgi:hypothetical protein